jgi:ribosomal protein L37E
MTDTDIGIRIRCQRCGAQMDLRDPAPGQAWPPQQFWECPRCGRHFWTTYPPPTREKTPKSATP